MRNKKTGRYHPGVHIDMTPMVDIMMLLVIFFMMSTVFIISQPAFSVALPQASAENQVGEPAVLLIGKDGRIALGEQVFEKHDLADNLKRAMSGKDGRRYESIIIKADKDVNHGQVVEVMDETQKAGILKISIAVEETSNNHVR